MRGEYIVTHKGETHVIPNTICVDGAEQFLAELFQGTAAATFYLGLCNQVPDNGDTHADITTEPTIGTGGYARIALARNSTDFPAIASANNESYVTSKAVTFTASGPGFDAAFSRLFLCSTATLFAGILFSYSAALATAITLAAGDTYIVQYRFYLS